MSDMMGCDSKAVAVAILGVSSIGLYHGARATIVAAQQAVGAGTGGNVTAYAPVKAHLLASKDSAAVDVAKYIDEVFKSR